MTLTYGMSSADISDRVLDAVGFITPSDPEWEQIKAPDKSPSCRARNEHSALRLLMRYPRDGNLELLETELNFFLWNTSVVSWRSSVFALGILFLSSALGGLKNVGY